MAMLSEMLPPQRSLRLLATCAGLLACRLACAMDPAVGSEKAPAAGNASLPAQADEHFKAERQDSDGSVLIDGRKIDYQAVAGTLVVHGKDWDDVPQNADKDEKKPPAEASMFYVAYFAKDRENGKPQPARPLTFLYNGGPGSSTLWLHMGAFGPRRVLTANDSHTPPAPYGLVNNEFSLLDASDLVFIDAPGTGFSRIAGKDKEKAFFGVDADAQAFADFIGQFLSRYKRWNSPKFLFGESYGTTRNAVLVNVLEQEKYIDFNGVIDLSQAQIWEAFPDWGDINPGVELPYELALPTYAATGWYHHRLPNAPKELRPLLDDVERFALNEYAAALGAGAGLDASRRRAVVEKLHEYTGLPPEYIEKANLRISGGEFAKALEGDADLTVGRFDSRFSGPTMDPMSKEADYDPQSAAIASAYVAALNAYLRSDLKLAPDRGYKPLIEVFRVWNFQHQAPGAPIPLPLTLNVLPDLAAAMKYNPKLKVLLNAGYFDLATPYFQAVYEMEHLPIPASLRTNIEIKFYESGHMVYAHAPSLKALHDNVADFIRRAVGAAAK